MKAKPIKAQAFRYYEGTAPDRWDVAVYWSHNPDSHPHDMDLLLSQKEWHKFSGLPGPPRDTAMEVEIGVKLLRTFAEPT